MGGSFIPKNGSWRIYTGGDYGSGSWATQEVAVSGIQNGDKIIIAYCIHDVGGKAANNQTCALHFATSKAALDAGTGTIVGAQIDTDKAFRLRNDAVLTDTNTIPTTVLSCTTESGCVHEAFNPAGYEDFGSSSHHELWFSIEAYDVDPSTTYYFGIDVGSFLPDEDAEITDYMNLTTPAPPTDASDNLSSNFSIQRAGTQAASSSFSIQRDGSASASANVTVRNVGSASMSSSFSNISTDSESLSSSFVVPYFASDTLSSSVTLNNTASLSCSLSIGWFRITSVSCNPSRVQRSNPGLIELRVDWFDASDLAITEYSVDFYLRGPAPDEDEYGPFTGTIVKDRPKYFHAVYDWDPGDGVDLSTASEDYDVKAVVGR